MDIPKGYELVKIKEEINPQIARINELKQILGKEPTDKELIEFGKQEHPYYRTLQEIQNLEE